jgi:hypothetical protein
MELDHGVQKARVLGAQREQPRCENPLREQLCSQLRKSMLSRACNAEKGMVFAGRGSAHEPNCHERISKLLNSYAPNAVQTKNWGTTIHLRREIIENSACFAAEDGHRLAVDLCTRPFRP